MRSLATNESNSSTALYVSNGWQKFTQAEHKHLIKFNTEEKQFNWNCKQYAMDENKTFRCNVPGCTKAFWFKSALTRHLSRHNGNDPDAPTVSWGCSECTKLFSKVESLRRHYRTSHGNVFVYPCEYEGCNQMFQRKDNLVRHAASHSENKKICDVCGKSFARKDALTRHKTIHTRKAQLSKNAANRKPSPSQEHLNATAVQMWALKCDKLLYEGDAKKDEAV